MDSPICPKEAADIASMNKLSKNERIANVRIMLPFARSSFAYPALPWLSRAARMKGLNYIAKRCGLEGYRQYHIIPPQPPKR